MAILIYNLKVSQKLANAEGDSVEQENLPSFISNI